VELRGEHLLEVLPALALERDVVDDARGVEDAAQRRVGADPGEDARERRLVGDVARLGGDAAALFPERGEACARLFIRSPPAEQHEAARAARGEPLGELEADAAEPSCDEVGRVGAQRERRGGRGGDRADALDESLGAAQRDALFA